MTQAAARIVEGPKKCLPQSFLQHGGSLEDLKSGYGINHRRGLEYPNLVSLKYSMIDSPMADPLVQQCRGLILDEADGWKIVARPFDKFFNEGESHAANLNWQSSVCLEKLDGSLCILYWYRGDWRVATSGTPDAMGEVKAGLRMTFKDLFWSTWNNKLYLKPREHWKDKTFLFELCSPMNRIVVNQSSERLVFLGLRDRTSGEEMFPDEFPSHSYKWEQVKQFPLYNLRDIVKTFETINPLEQEGYVIVDSWFDRIKVKHPGYVALHHMRGDGFGPRRIVDAIRNGEVSEILASFPEWKDDFARYQHRYADLVAHIEAEWERLKDIPGGYEDAELHETLRREFQKTYAMEAVKCRCSGALFALRRGHAINVREYLKDMMIDSLLILLESAE